MIKEKIRYLLEVAGFHGELQSVLIRLIEKEQAVSYVYAYPCTCTNENMIDR